MAYTKDEWWHTTPAGARIGWLQPPVFLQQVTQLSGEPMHQSRAPLIRFAWWAGVGTSTVYRWADGTDPIPKWVALLLTSMLQLQAGDLTFPVNVKADWLPYTEGANGRQCPVDQPPDGDAQPTKRVVNPVDARAFGWR